MLREYTVISRYGYHSIEIAILNRNVSAKFWKVPPGMGAK